MLWKKPIEKIYYFLFSFCISSLAPGIKSDDHILLAIRPEHVGFAAPNFAGQAVAGEITAATFLGERSHVHVRIAGRSDPVAVSGNAPPTGLVHLVFPPDKLMGLPMSRDAL